MAWPRKIEAILSPEIALDDTGIDNWALSK
jgi:hypothetical protein